VLSHRGGLRCRDEPPDRGNGTGRRAYARADAGAERAADGRTRHPCCARVGSTPVHSYARAGGNAVNGYRASCERA